MASNDAYTGKPISGPIELTLVFVMPRGCQPPWLTKRDWPGWFAAWKRGDRVPHLSPRDDRDNLLKSFQDALNGVLWKDDGHIFAGPTEKWIAGEGEQPHVEVAIIYGEDGDAL